MTITQRIAGVCVHPAWLALLGASMSGPASIAVALCVLLRMLHGIEAGRLLAALAAALGRAPGGVARNAASPPVEFTVAPMATPPRPSGRRDRISRPVRADRAPRGPHGR